MLPLSDVLAAFQQSTRLAPKTISVYRTSLSQFEKCLSRPPRLRDLCDANLLLFERWLSAGRSPYTVRERTSRLKCLWRFACKRGWLQEWPTISPTPVPEIRPQAYSIEQIRVLLRAADSMTNHIGRIRQRDWWRAWLTIAYVTGERTGALRRLRWEHVDWGRRVLDLPGDIRKGGKAHVHYLTDEAVDSLRPLRTNRQQLVFFWDRSESAFFLRFNKLLKLAGLPPGRRNQTQRIRRTHLTLWAAAGGDATARAMHSSSAVTWKHYLDRTYLPAERPEDRLPKLG